MGAGVAAGVAASRPMLLAMVIGVLTAAGSVMMLTMLPGPVWMWSDPVLNLAEAWGVAELVVRRKAAATGSSPG